MAFRSVLFRPLAPDGSGDPGITRGVYAISAAKKLKFQDLGEWQPTAPLIFTIAGVAVPKDLPVIEAADHNALIVKSYFGPTARYPDTPSFTEAVLVPAGAGSIDFEDLPRVDAATLGPVTTVPSAVELRIEALEAGGGPGSPVLSVAGKTGAVSLVVNDIGGITEPGLTALKVTGATLADRQAAFRAAIGSGASGLVIGTTAGTAADASLVALKASPAFTGNPTAPTPTAGDNDTSIATTAFVTAAMAANVNSAPQMNIASAGAYAPRHTGSTSEFFLGTTPPGNDGSTSGGGGMVPGLDLWFEIPA